MRLFFLGSFVLPALTLAFACSDSKHRDFAPGMGQGASSSGQGGSLAEAGAGTSSQGGTDDSGAAGEDTGASGGSAPLAGADSGAAGAMDPVGNAGAGGQGESGPRALACEDQMRTDFPLVGGKLNAGDVSNTPHSGGFDSVVDATSGGLANAPMNPWVYLRFTAQGLVKVDLDDEQALDSLDWDIAAKRFGLRLNGGDGGPSYVEAATFPTIGYDNVSSVPATAVFASDNFYNGQCELQTGELGWPTLLLDSYYRYEGCNMMTGTTFVLRLTSGEHLKLAVMAYYASGQEQCDTQGQPGTGGATFTLRWHFL